MVNMINSWIMNQLSSLAIFYKGIDTSADPSKADNGADQSDGKDHHPWLPKDWNRNYLEMGPVEGGLF